MTKADCQSLCLQVFTPAMKCTHKPVCKDTSQYVRVTGGGAIMGALSFSSVCVSLSSHYPAVNERCFLNKENNIKDAMVTKTPCKGASGVLTLRCTGPEAEANEGREMLPSPACWAQVPRGLMPATISSFPGCALLLATR